jgi:hypothetical protein
MVQGFELRCRLETAPQSEALRRACHDVLHSWASIVAAHARRHGLENAADTLGAAMVLGLEGAWVLARATRTTRPFDVAADMAVALASVSDGPR